MRLSAQAGSVVNRSAAGMMTLSSARYDMGRPPGIAGCPLVTLSNGKVQVQACNRSRNHRCNDNLSQIPLNLCLGAAEPYLDFFAGSAGRAPLQGSYFSFGSGMRSSAAL